MTELIVTVFWWFIFASVIALQILLVWIVPRYWKQADNVERFTICFGLFVCALLIFVEWAIVEMQYNG